MKTTLTQDQMEQLNSLIEETIVPALLEDGICEPDMSDVDKDSNVYDEVYEERTTNLYVEAIKYINNNLN